MYGRAKIECTRGAGFDYLCVYEGVTRPAASSRATLPKEPRWEEYSLFSPDRIAVQGWVGGWVGEWVGGIRGEGGGSLGIIGTGAVVQCLLESLERRAV